MKKFNKLLTGIFYILISIIFIMLITIHIFSIKELIIPIIIALISILVFIIISKKIKSKYIYIVINSLIILLIIVSTIVILFLGKTKIFLDSVANSNIEIKSYYLLVLKESNTIDYEDLIDKKVGSTSEDYNEFLNDIDTKIKLYDSYTNMLIDLFSNDITAIFIDDIYYTNMKELIPNFDDCIKVLKTFEKKQLIEVNESNINVKDNPFIIYISGIDTYGSIEKLGRSDVNILAAINPKESKILLISIPRDYYVRLSGTNGYRDKLTHAGVYGIDMSIKTIEELLDIDIDYYLRVNFNTIIKLVDSIGGIDIYSDTTFVTSNDKNCYLKTGNNHINGECALSFSRERFIYSGGDRHRGENQQEVISGIIQKVTTTDEILTNYLNILDKMKGSFQTNFKVEDLSYFLKKQLKDRNNWEIDKISLDGYDSYNYTYSYSENKLYVMEPNYDTISKAKENINLYTKK